MLTATKLLQGLARVSGLLQIALGLLFWTGNALQLLPLHMLNGLLLVLIVWVLSGLALRAGVSRGLVALAILWGFITPVLGISHPSLLPGSFHWVIEVVHLLVGLALLAQADALASRIKRLRAPNLATEY